MKLRYETAIATMIQFIVLSFLGIANGLDSVVTTCHNSSGDCVSNLLVSLIFFLLTAGWFGFVWALGFAAQERRTKHLARILILAEVFIALIAIFNAKHHPDWLSFGTSLIDFGLAIWIIRLAWRLMRADGKRIVKPQRQRRGTPKLDT